MTRRRHRARLAIVALVLLPARPSYCQQPTQRDVEVSIASDRAVLACTLSEPATQGRHPAVMLLSGSGQHDRDWDIDGDGRYKMARLLAEPLLGAGIAVLRCDDRGASKSTGGSEVEASFDQLTQDALAGLELLRARPGISTVGLCGHSGGAEIAVRAAARSENVGFLVLLSGPFVSGADVLLDQARTFPQNLVPRPMSPESRLAEALDLQARHIRAWRTGEGLDALASAFRKNNAYMLNAMPEADRKKIADMSAEIEKQTADMMKMFDWNWFKSFVDYNPASDLRSLTCPVLAVYGAEDRHVGARNGWKALYKALGNLEHGPADVTVQVLPKGNHFLTSREHALKGRMTPGAPEAIATWIRARWP